MTRFLYTVLFLVFSLNLPTLSHANALEKELKESVKYLEEIPQVKWVKVRRNSVIVGWKGFPPKFNLINTEAALKGTQATGRTVQSGQYGTPRKTGSPDAPIFARPPPKIEKLREPPAIFKGSCPSLQVHKGRMRNPHQLNIFSKLREAF